MHTYLLHALFVLATLLRFYKPDFWLLYFVLITTYLRPESDKQVLSETTTARLISSQGWLALRLDVFITHQTVLAHALGELPYGTQ